MPRMMRRLYVALAIGPLAACATAGKDNGLGEHPDAGGNKPDGSTQPPIDAAPLPDAPPGQTQLTLSQTNNNTPAAGQGQACGHSVFGNTVSTADNSWYRVFKLADYGVTGAFNVQRVTFYSDYAWAGGGTSQPATLKIGTYSGALEVDRLPAASITNIVTQPVTIPDNTGAPAAIDTNVSATIPAGSNLIVELALPDGDADGNYFYIGVSAGGEQKKGYIRATPSGCGFTSPTSLVSPTGLNIANNAVLLSVTGTK